MVIYGYMYIYIYIYGYIWLFTPFINYGPMVLYLWLYYGFFYPTRVTWLYIPHSSTVVISVKP
jgi:hypothetical protein